MAATTTAAERHERRTLVEALMLRGARPTQILEAVRARWPALHAHAIWADRRWVERRWKIDSSRRMEKRRARVLAQLEATTSTAMGAGEFSAAIAGLALQARILGLWRPEGILLQLQNHLHVNEPLHVLGRRLVETIEEQFGPVVDVEAQPPVLPAPTNGKAAS